MDTNTVYRCSKGCRNCPRMRGCFAAAAPAVPANAEAPELERPVPDETVSPRPAAAAPAPVEETADALPETARTEPATEPQDAPETEGVGLPALDTPSDSVPYISGSAMEQYLEKNCEQGILRIQAFRGQQAIPVEGVAVTVRCPVGGDLMVFFEGSTDSSGVIDPILLPAPKPETSLAPGQEGPCSEYEVIAAHPEFETLTTMVMVFPGIKTIQPLQMRLKGV